MISHHILFCSNPLFPIPFPSITVIYARTVSVLYSISLSFWILISSIARQISVFPYWPCVRLVCLTFLSSPFLLLPFLYYSDIPLLYPTSYLLSYNALLYSTLLSSILLNFPLEWQDCVLPLLSSPLLYPVHHILHYTPLYSTLLYSISL